MFVPDAWRPWTLPVLSTLVLLALLWLSPLWTPWSRLEHALLSSLSAPALPDAAALDSLERARLADPLDPLSWQVQAILQNDSGEPAQ